MGKTSAWYSNIERAKKIAEILGVDIREIFFEDNLNATFNYKEQPA